MLLKVRSKRNGANRAAGTICGPTHGNCNAVMKPASEFRIGSRQVGLAHPTYFIADIAANHDGDLARAKDLIYLAAEAGADAAKFQHFKAETIVSDEGFKAMDAGRMSHQAAWKKSVFEVYKDASVDPDWTEELKAACEKAKIEFFTSPYAFDIVDAIDPHVPAFKIGSGDITWPEFIHHVAKKGKPTILACGAATFDDIERAVSAVLSVNANVALLQCNTNYTASPENFRFIQLNVLRTFADMYPGMVLGLSDHTPGHATVLGSIALGGRIVEKHFTDDQRRTGPDHKFSMTPATWRDMVDRSRELEYALGNGIKRVEDNEKDTVVIQRRGLRAARDLAEGAILRAEDLVSLRPCPADGLPPYRLSEVVGKSLRKGMKKGDHITWTHLG